MSAPWLGTRRSSAQTQALSTPSASVTDSGRGAWALHFCLALFLLGFWFVYWKRKEPSDTVLAGERTSTILSEPTYTL